MISFDLWLLDSTLIVSIVLASGFAAMLMLRNPARQQRVGELAVIGALAAMMLTALPGLPHVFLRWLPAADTAKSSLTVETFHIGLTPQKNTGRRSNIIPILRRPQLQNKRGSFWRSCLHRWPEYISRAYFLGVVLMAGRLVLGWQLLRKASAKATPFSADFHIESLASAGPLRRNLKSTVVRISEEIQTPMAFGMLHPVILLPKSFCGADVTMVRMALTHELTHIVRGDTIWRVILALAAVPLFFHPLLWILSRRIRLNQEFLADHSAAALAESPATYITAMLQLARGIKNHPDAFFPATALFGRRSDFYLRMNRLLTQGNSTTADCSGRWYVGAVAGTMLILMPASMITLASPAKSLSTANGAQPKSGTIHQEARQLARSGLAYLGRRQNASGAWLGRYGPAVTAMVVRGFLEAGVSAGNIHVKRGLRFIESNRRSDGGFYNNVEPAYNTAIVLRTLSMLPEPRYQRQARRGLAFLHQQLRTSVADPGSDAAWYMHRSLFRLQVPGNRFAQSEKTVSHQITSGLWISGKMLDPRERGADAVLRQYGSITYAQLKSMIYAGLQARDPRVVHLSHWISTHYALNYNPAENGSQGLYYYYVVFARVLRAAGRERVIDADGVSHNWRRDLVVALAGRRRANGSWKNGTGSAWLEGNPVMATTYAVLSLDQVTR